ncbi:hypothetical protein P8452_24024 [Trifolium repens]|nr:hypothetical protein P8452_24024 [Trifolium repens]
MIGLLFSFFSSTSPNITTSRVDVVVFVIWELVILAFLVFSVVSLYFKHIRLAFILVFITVLLLLCMKITKQGLGHSSAFSIDPASHSSLSCVTSDSAYSKSTKEYNDAFTSKQAYPVGSC